MTAPWNPGNGPVKSVREMTDSEWESFHALSKRDIDRAFEAGRTSDATALRERLACHLLLRSTL